MTLIIGMSKPEGIYLSVDYRVTDARTGKLIDDSATKNLIIYYPPLPAGGTKVLLGFTGLAILPDGTPTLTWIRETLRGETQAIDHSMAHLLDRLNRDIVPVRVPLIITVLALYKERRFFGGFTNQGRTALMPKFEYMMNELNDWTAFSNGSAGSRLVTDGHFTRLRPHLSIVPREPMNHMKLLAIINRQVAKKDRGVSPFCHVSFINSDARFGTTSHRFTERGETAPFEIPMLVGGIDLTDSMRIHHRNAQALFKGEISALPELDKDTINKSLKRRP